MNLATFGAQLYHKTRIQKLPAATVGPWLRTELQSLGPVAAKCGQWASNRPDIFGDLADELVDLQQRAEPIPPHEVLRMTQGLPVVFDPASPIAAASMGQVHVGVLADGRKVAIKVQRPGLLKAFRRDTLVLKAFAVLGKRLNPGAADAETLVLDLLDSFKQEADFLREGRTMAAFQKGAPPGVRVPKPYLEFSSPTVLVMEYLPSTPVSAVTKRRRELAIKLMHTFMHQLLETDMLHTDLHPGNYGVLGDDLVLYDFGNVVTIPAELTFAIKNFVLCMVTDNVDNAVRVIRDDLRLKIVDEQALKEWISVYFRYTKTPGLDASKLRVSNVRAQPVVFTPELTKIMRAFSSLEGVCTSLDPDFQYYELFETFVESILMSQGFMERKASQDLSLALNFFREFPR